MLIRNWISNSHFTAKCRLYVYWFLLKEIYSDAPNSTIYIYQNKENKHFKLKKTLFLDSKFKTDFSQVFFTKHLHMYLVWTYVWYIYKPVMDSVTATATWKKNWKICQPNVSSFLKTQSIPAYQMLFLTCLIKFDWACFKTKCGRYWAPCIHFLKNPFYSTGYI